MNLAIAKLLMLVNLFLPGAIPQGIIYSGTVAPSTPSFVQACANSAYNGGGVTTASAVCSGVASGNALFYGASEGHISDTLTVSDNCGGTNHVVDSSATNDTYNQGYESGVSGNCTVSAVNTLTGQIVNILVHEVHNQNATPVDDHNIHVNVATGTGTDAQTSNSFSPSANDYIFGWCSDEGGSFDAFTAGTSFTSRQSLTGTGGSGHNADSEDRTTSSSGAATYTVTVGTGYVACGGIAVKH